MVLVAGTGFLVMFGGGLSRSSMALMEDLVARSGQIPVTPDDIPALFMDLLLRSAWLAGPMVALVVLVVIASNVAQFGLISAPEALAPKWSRINPGEGLRRIFSLQSVMELWKGLLKLGIVAWVLWRSIMAEWEILVSLGSASAWTIGREMAQGILKIGIRSGLVLAGLALLDYLYQRWEHERSLRMTKEEVKEEFKQREGDPKVRARIRQRQREMARRRMMAAVPKADVVITNPEHLAVALQYDRARMAAPTVVAKGAGRLAQKIKEVALAHGVETVENRPLAQVLYRNVEVGGQIPVELYKAVAEILAHVYRKKQGTSRPFSRPQMSEAFQQR